MQSLHFLLVPDSSAARRVRRAIAEQGAYRDVLIGTWPELVEYARNIYLLPQLKNDWDGQFQSALSEMGDAFWAESFTVSPIETSVSIKAAFLQIISASDPKNILGISDCGDLPQRPRRHLEDLIQLAEVLKGELPSELSVIIDFIEADVIDAIQKIFVHHIEDIPALTRWQVFLIDKLNADAKESLGSDYSDKLKVILQNVEGKKLSGSLATLQEKLFSLSKSKVELDDSLQWVGARDFLEEAEVAAAMVQSMLDQHSDLRPTDIGLLLPDSIAYSIAINDAFSLAGLALSGLPVERDHRDLGREVIFHFLYCRQKPAPAMALAVCLSSPLMPWSRENGAILAQTVMDGNYTLRPFPSANKNDRAMLDLIRDSDESTNTLIEAVQSFVSLLNTGESSHENDFIEYACQAKTVADSLCTTLKQAADIDWMNLRRSVNPRTITSGVSPDFNLEGITVWREGHEPWRSVRHLIVFGFAEGSYPTSVGSSSVFVADDINAIRENLGLSVETFDERLMRSRARFKRQLGAVSDFVSFLVPRRNASGSAQAPSESLVFMQQLFDAPENIILELDSVADREAVRYLVQAEAIRPVSPRTFVANDMHFKQDLLMLRKDSEGQQKPESPSSLETLMVSRFAWLLRRLDAEPLGWLPESPNVMLLGTLAHQVFEDLFQTEMLIPTKKSIDTRIANLLDDAIKQHAPFLRASQWQVERQHLATGITKAAQVWKEILDTLGAEVLGSEVWLAGKLNGISIHGQADVILGLPENRLLIVDYKRSSSSGRRPRMNKSYDSQANLYRTMLQTGGPKSDSNNVKSDVKGDIKNKERLERLNATIRKSTRTGIVYYMMNDQVALSDSRLLESDAISHWEALEGDVSSLAMTLIDKRLNEVQAGMICLNREGDEIFFDKNAGVKPYALDNSPLISLFTILGEAEEVE